MPLTLPPVLYLDVDGVIAPLPASEPVDRMRESGWQHWRRARAWGFEVDYSVQMVSWLNVFANSERLLPMWCSSWGARAASDLAPAIGMRAGRWPYLQGSGTGWKLAEVLAHHPRGAHAVWIDDDLDVDEVGAALDAEGIGHTLLVPDPWVGLTRAHADEIQQVMYESGGSRPTPVLK